MVKANNKVSQNISALREELKDIVADINSGQIDERSLSEELSAIADELEIAAYYVESMEDDIAGVSKVIWQG